MSIYLNRRGILRSKVWMSCVEWMYPCTKEHCWHEHGRLKDASASDTWRYPQDV